MESKLVEALRVKNPPVAVILTDEKPAQAMQFKAGGAEGVRCRDAPRRVQWTRRCVQPHHLRMPGRRRGSRVR